MTPERMAELEKLEAALRPFQNEAYEAGLKAGHEQGYIFAVHDLEAEVARIADAGKLDDERELVGALSKAAGWLRRKNTKRE